MDIRALVDVIQTNKCKVRMKVKGHSAPEYWNDWAILPTSGYIKTGNQGPWPIHQVEWLEINPIITEHIGRLVAPRVINSLSEIEAKMREAELPYTVLEGIIKVFFSDTMS